MDVHGPDKTIINFAISFKYLFQLEKVLHGLLVDDSQSTSLHGGILRNVGTFNCTPFDVMPVCWKVLCTAMSGNQPILLHEK